MAWIRVMTLRDGTTVEVPVPSPEDGAECEEHCYRVRSADTFIEFATLAEVTNDLLERTAAAEGC